MEIAFDDDSHALLAPGAFTEVADPPSKGARGSWIVCTENPLTRLIVTEELSFASHHPVLGRAIVLAEVLESGRVPLTEALDTGFGSELLWPPEGDVLKSGAIAHCGSELLDVFGFHMG